jgi:hypothetical protein
MLALDQGEGVGHTLNEEASYDPEGQAGIELSEGVDDRLSKVVCMAPAVDAKGATKAEST